MDKVCKDVDTLFNDFVGTSVSWQDFDASRLPILLIISPFSWLKNSNKLFSLDIFSIL